MRKHATIAISMIVTMAVRKMYKAKIDFAQIRRQSLDGWFVEIRESLTADILACDFAQGGVLEVLVKALEALT